MLLDLSVPAHIIIFIILVAFYGLLGEILNQLHEKHYKKRTYIVWIPLLREYILLKIVFGEIISIVLSIIIIIIFILGFMLPGILSYILNTYFVARLLCIIFVITEFVYIKIKKIRRRKKS